MKNILAFLPLFLVLGCTKFFEKSTSVSMVAKAPDDAVRAFVELSASSKDQVDKKKLETLCSGELRRAFERMTDEAFRLSYLNNSIKLNELKILESKIEGESARVRYQVNVENSQGTDPTKENNEREVELVKSQGSWYIDSIKPKGSDQIAFTNGMIF